MSVSSPLGRGGWGGVLGAVGWVWGGCDCIGVMLPWVGEALVGAGVGEVRYSSTGTVALLFLGIVGGLPKAGGKKRAPLGGGTGQGVVGGEVGAFRLLVGRSIRRVRWGVVFGGASYKGSCARSPLDWGTFLLGAGDGLGILFTSQSLLFMNRAYLT